MRLHRSLLAFLAVGAAACGPTYVVQGPPPGPAPQRVPPPPVTPPLEVSIVRAEDARVLIQTSRQAYVAVFEIVPGRGTSLVYPEPVRPRNVQSTGLTWVNVYWTMRPDYRWASNDTRYIYAVASDTPLRLDDDLYDSRAMERRLGSSYWSSNPNTVVRAIEREFVRAQPDEWWGESMTTMSLVPPRVNVVIRLARVYCPDGNYFEVRDDMVEEVWCPARRGGPRHGERPGASLPDSVFSSNGRRVARHLDPSKRTPVFRVPAGNEVGEQQGHPINQPQNPPPTYPRTQPQTPGPQIPTTGNQPGQPQTPPQTSPQNPPPQTQPQTPPQNQPPQTQPSQPPVQDTSANGNDKGNNGRRAHGDPRNADPRGNGNGYGNGGRNTQPTSSTPPSSNPPQSTPQPQQQGQPQTSPGNSDQGHGNGNSNPGNASNGNNGKANGDSSSKHPNDAKPDHDKSKGGVSALIKSRVPSKQDDKAAKDSTSKKP